MIQAQLSYTNINGKIAESSKAAVRADNGAFRYGYGLFETLLVQNGTIELEHLHMARLFAGMEQLFLGVPKLMTADNLRHEILKTVEKNAFASLCRVRLQVYAGGGGIFGEGAQKPEFVIECFPLTAENIGLNGNGLVLGMAEGVTKYNGEHANLKSCNALVYALAGRQSHINKWNDALVCNNHGHIIESSIANIFWIKDGIIHTPPLTDGCIAGVMRSHIISSLERSGKRVVTEKHLTRDLLADADEVFLTNAIKRIKWVGRFENKTYTNLETLRIHADLFNTD